jgi:hypothetical protein
MEPEERTKKINKVIAKAWLDEGFKKKLLADPNGTLKAEGVEVSPDVQIHIAEDTAKVHNLVLPLKPSTDEVSDEQLRSGGGGKFLTLTTFQCGGPCVHT